MNRTQKNTSLLILKPPFFTLNPKPSILHLKSKKSLLFSFNCLEDEVIRICKFRKISEHYGSAARLLDINSISASFLPWWLLCWGRGENSFHFLWHFRLFFCQNVCQVSVPWPSKLKWFLIFHKTVLMALLPEYSELLSKLGDFIFMRSQGKWLSKLAVQMAHMY